MRRGRAWTKRGWASTGENDRSRAFWETCRVAPNCDRHRPPALVSALASALGMERRETGRRAAIQPVPAASGVTPDLVPPIDDVTLRIQPSRRSNDHGRAERLPGMFLLPHPLQPDRTSRQRACKQRSIGCRIIGTIVSVAARSLGVDAAHALNRHPQHFRNGGAIRIDALGMGPDCQRIDQTAQPRTMARWQRAPGRVAYRSHSLSSPSLLRDFPRPAP